MGCTNNVYQAILHLIAPFRPAERPPTLTLRETQSKPISTLTYIVIFPWASTDYKLKSL